MKRIKRPKQKSQKVLITGKAATNHKDNLGSGSAKPYECANSITDKTSIHMYPVLAIINRALVKKHTNVPSVVVPIRTGFGGHPEPAEPDPD
jgi:hypothetical protein